MNNKFKIVDVTDMPMSYMRRVFGINNEEDIYSIFEGDPDYVIANGFKTVFIEHDKYIIVAYLDEYKEIIEVIERWLNGEGKDIPNCSWDKFDRMKNAVAYRGGRGYSYTITNIDL